MIPLAKRALSLKRIIQHVRVKYWHRSTQRAKVQTCIKEYGSKLWILTCASIAARGCTWPIDATSLEQLKPRSTCWMRCCRLSYVTHYCLIFQGGSNGFVRLPAVGTLNEYEYRVKTAALCTLKRYSILSLTLYLEWYSAYSIVGSGGPH
jgi:hypothetical protein